MRDTAENRGAIQAVVRQLAGRFRLGFPLEPDYAKETGRVLLSECSSLAVLASVANELMQFERLPYAREIEALARKNTPERTGKFYDRCERGCDEGWQHFETVRNGIPYSFAKPCHCRKGIGGGR